MSNFQAIVVRPSLPQRLGRNGHKTELKVWMPPSGDLPIEKLDALQAAYAGALEIVPEAREGRLLIIQRHISFSHKSVQKVARKLAAQVQIHLGIPTTVQ